MLQFCESRGALFRDGKSFDPWHLRWSQEAGDRPDAGIGAVAPVEAMGWLFRHGGGRRVPLAIIGPKVATQAQIVVAERLGARIGELGVPLVTGGKSGVMEAASRGCARAGGMPIGILPDEEWTAANDHVAIPLATGIGPARNAIIARAAFALIAVGGEHGTLSEMALGIHFGRLVLALEDAPQVPGAVVCKDADEALERVALRLFGLDA